MILCEMNEYFGLLHYPKQMTDRKTQCMLLNFDISSDIHIVFTHVLYAMCAGVAISFEIIF